MQKENIVEYSSLDMSHAERITEASEIIDRLLNFNLTEGEYIYIDSITSSVSPKTLNNLRFIRDKYAKSI